MALVLAVPLETTVARTRPEFWVLPGTLTVELGGGEGVGLPECWEVLSLTGMGVMAI